MRLRLASSDSATAAPMRPNSVDGIRTLVPTTTFGFSFASTRPRFFSDSPLPYIAAVSK